MPIMKESMKSLKTYFVIIAVFMFLGSSKFLNQGWLGIVLGLEQLIFGLLYIYIATSLKKLLSSSPKFIIKVLIVNLAIVMCLDLFLIIAGLIKPFVIIQLIISPLINWYLIINVKRLSAEIKNQINEASVNS